MTGSFDTSRGRAKTWILKLTSMGDYTKVAFRYPRIYEIELSVTSYLLAETMSLSIFRGTTLKLLKNKARVHIKVDHLGEKIFLILNEA